MTAKVYRLADCNEFRQTLLVRPPVLARACWVAGAGLVLAAVGWAAATPANLVVRCPARVRPGADHEGGFGAISGQKLAFSVGGRVAAVHVQPGQTVRPGDPVAALDTERVDNDIRRQQEAIRNADHDLTRLAAQLKLHRDQQEAAVGRARAELATAVEEVRQTRERRQAELRSAEADAERAAASEMRYRELVAAGAAAATEFQDARVRHLEAQERVTKARQPVEDGKVRALELALATIRAGFDIQGKELEARAAQRAADREAARTELANLELERRHHTLTAPVGGVVTVADVRPGDVVAAGREVAAVADTATVRIDLAIPGRDAGNVRVGMPVKVKIDAFDFRQYGTLDGTITDISPDAQPLDAVGSPAAAVYVARVAIAGTEVGRGNDRGTVRIGMTGKAEVVTGRERLLTLLLRRLRQDFSLA